MVYAEKIITALQRGSANTRWRDFADLYLLIGRHRIDGDQLQRALSTVAAYRQVASAPLAEVLDGYAALAQPRWLAWRRKQHLVDRLPQSFAEVLVAVVTFADPALDGTVDGRRWDPATGTWT